MRQDWQSVLFEQSMLANPTSMLFFMAGMNYNKNKIISHVLCFKEYLDFLSL